MKGSRNSNPSKIEQLVYDIEDAMDAKREAEMNLRNARQQLAHHIIYEEQGIVEEIVARATTSTILSAARNRGLL